MIPYGVVLVAFHVIIDHSSRDPRLSKVSSLELSGL